VLERELVFRTLNDVRSTLANWRREYNCERPDSSLDYRTPEEFRQRAGYAEVESKQRFPHPHSLDYDGCEIISKQNQNWETPVRYGLYATWLVDDAAVPGQSPIVAHRAMTRAMSKTFSLCRDFDGDPDAFKQTETSTEQHS